MKGYQIVEEMEYVALKEELGEMVLFGVGGGNTIFVFNSVMCCCRYEEKTSRTVADRLSRETVKEMSLYVLRFF